MTHIDIHHTYKQTVTQHVVTSHAQYTHTQTLCTAQYSMVPTHTACIHRIAHYKHTLHAQHSRQSMVPKVRWLASTATDPPTPHNIMTDSRGNHRHNNQPPCKTGKSSKTVRVKINEV